MKNDLKTLKSLLDSIWDSTPKTSDFRLDIAKIQNKVEDFEAELQERLKKAVFEERDLIEEILGE